MSVKIYEAYVFDSKYLWQFTSHVVRYGQRNVTKKIRKAVEVLQTEIPSNLPVARMAINRRYVEQVTKPYKDAFDFDVSVSLHEYAGRIYAIPYVGMGSKGCLNFLKRISYVEDYSYWNNTDRPEEVGDEEWNKRGEVWDKLDKKWQRMLVIDICNHKNFNSLLWSNS